MQDILLERYGIEVRDPVAGAAATAAPLVGAALQFTGAV